MRTTSARRLRWAAPVVAGAAVAAAAIIPGVAAGSDHPNLPTLTAAQLLTDLATSRPPALSGTIVESARLGLPELPSTGGADAELNWQNLVTGSHTARVWLDGAERQRIALVGDLAESDVVHNGTDVWVYSSSSQVAVHMTVPERDKNSAEAAPVPTPLLTPSQAAAQALAAVDPTTRVSVDDTARVAGRAAYQLVLAPDDPRVLVGSVTIAVDADTKVPLRVQVYARGSGTPAFETTFTDISLTRPPASVFRFTPPTGVQVQQSTLPRMAADGGAVHRRVETVLPKPSGTGAGGLRLIGTGWTSVAVMDNVSPAASQSGRRSSGSQMINLLTHAATRVPEGLLLRTALVTALLTDDGHLYVGAVDPVALQQVVRTGKPL